MGSSALVDRRLRYDTQIASTMNATTTPSTASPNDNTRKKKPEKIAAIGAWVSTYTTPRCANHSRTDNRGAAPCLRERANAYASSARMIVTAAPIRQIDVPTPPSSLRRRRPGAINRIAPQTMATWVTRSVADMAYQEERVVEQTTNCVRSPSPTVRAVTGRLARCSARQFDRPARCT